MRKKLKAIMAKMLNANGKDSIVRNGNVTELFVKTPKVMDLSINTSLHLSKIGELIYLVSDNCNFPTFQHRVSGWEKSGIMLKLSAKCICYLNHVGSNKVYVNVIRVYKGRLFSAYTTHSLDTEVKNIYGVVPVTDQRINLCCTKNNGEKVDIRLDINHSLFTSPVYRQYIQDVVSHGGLKDGVYKHRWINDNTPGYLVS